MWHRKGMSSGEVPGSDGHVFELSYDTLFMDANQMVLERHGVLVHRVARIPVPVKSSVRVVFVKTLPGYHSGVGLATDNATIVPYPGKKTKDITISNDADAPHSDFTVVPKRGTTDPVLRVELACHRDGEGINEGGACVWSQVDSVRAGVYATYLVQGAFDVNNAQMDDVIYRVELSDDDARSENAPV